MSRGDRLYSGLIAGCLFLFFLASDGPFLAVRHGLLVALALAAVPHLLRHPREFAGTVLRPPLVFFAAFLTAGLGLSPFALAPASAAFHTLVFAGLMLFAVAAFETVSLAMTLALLRMALALKLIASLVLGFVAPRGGIIVVALANGTLAQRHVFGGLVGNPNPLCEAAAAYLLLAVCHIIERRSQWPTGARGWFQAGWYALTISVSGYLMWQSLSRSAWVALALVVVAVGAATAWRGFGAELSRRRRLGIVVGSVIAAGIATSALLIWINADRGIGAANATTSERILEPIHGGGILDIASRGRYWEFALTKIRERPWTGYGTSATPQLYHQLVGPAKEHSHNLELEATLYAGVPAAILIVLFTTTTLWAASQAFGRRREHALSVAAVLLYVFILAQVEPVVFGSPYPSLLIILTLAAHLQHRQDVVAAPNAHGEQEIARAAREPNT